MFKKTITYTDYNGESRTEDFYFNLSKAELAEMELSEEGGLEQRINKIVQTKNTPEIYKQFKDVILKAYGEKSPDGRKFIKNEELRNDFVSTEAFSELIMEMLNDADAAVNFFVEIMPKVVGEHYKEIEKQNGTDNVVKM